MKIKELIEEIDKLTEAMYNVNRHVSFNYIAFANKRTLQEKDKMIRDLNRFVGEWIKRLREIKYEIKK